MYGVDYDKNHGLDNKDFPEQVCKKIKETFHDFSDPLYSNSRIIMSHKVWLEENYKDKNICIIGGGGSTNIWLKSDPVNLDLQREYDRIWSLNSFYKNEILSKQRLDLVSLGPEVNLQDPILLDYLAKKDPDVGIELHQKWSREELDHPLIKEINEFCPTNKFCFQTRYFSILGSGARLILLACELGVSSISFIGFDGPDAIWNADHSFEQGKDFMTFRCRGYPKEVVRYMFQQEYDWFWEYCKAVYPNTKIIPLNDSIYHRVLNG